MALPDSLYVARPAANSFLENLDLAFKSPAQQPIVFHAWGLGGVGKTTLLDRAQLAHRQRCTIPEQITIAEVKFGDTANTGTPLGVMNVLHSQLSSTMGDPQKDPFYELERRYTSTLETLKTKTEDGTAQASDKQIEIVKKYSQLALQGASLMLAAGNPVGTAMAVAAPRIGELGELGASILDDAKGLLNRHLVTRSDEKLKALMLNPLLELTKAFVKSLQAKAAVQPLLLVLDFYEKVLVEVDRWFCGTLLGNTSLQEYPVRIVSAGRKRLLNKDHWSERHQNDSAVYEQELESFEDEQAREYLQKIGIAEDTRVKPIITATRGLPYYLNWVREEYNKGNEPDFSEGAQEIKKLLLRQFTPRETQLVQIIACCRRFDGDLIKQLTRDENLEIPLQEKETAKGRFQWLLDLPFTQRTEKEHRFDDVARDVLRQAFYEESQQQFRDAHQALADHYAALADDEVWDDAHISEQYDSDDWRRHQAEALYHQLFADPKQAELQLISRILEGIYLSAEEIVQRPLQAIAAEYQEGDHPLIKSGLQKVLNHVKQIIEQGWRLRYSDNLEELLNHAGQGIGQSLAVCWKRTEKLTGLAKFVAYFYQGKYGADPQRLTWLNKAQDQAQEIITPEAPEFSSDLLTFYLGPSFRRLERYEDAIASYDAALKYNPDKHEAWNNRGIALRQLERYEEAITSYDAALKHKPDYHKAWTNRGTSFEHLGAYEKALASHEEALKHKPDSHLAWYNRGVQLGNLDRYEEAIASYDAALKHKPDDHEAWNNWGIALGKLERYEDAIASLDKALEIKPDKEEAHYNKACYYALLGNPDAALESLQQAINLAPKQNRELAKTDTDFDSLRNDPRFSDLMTS